MSASCETVTNTNVQRADQIKQVDFELTPSKQRLKGYPNFHACDGEDDNSRRPK